jgi:hypothetical protein
MSAKGINSKHRRQMPRVACIISEYQIRLLFHSCRLMLRSRPEMMRDDRDKNTLMMWPSRLTCPAS